MTDYIGTEKMYMAYVQSDIRVWKDKEGNDRYYVDIARIIDEYRDATDTQLRSYYDWGEMHASYGRVREILERNILPKSKAFIDGDGLVHVYGWATAGEGARLGLPRLIEKAIAYKYGMASPEIREKRADALIGKSGVYASTGDVVRIVKGRKSVGMEFAVSKTSEYRYSSWASPSKYLYESDDFKVNADNCEIVAVGCSCDMDDINRLRRGRLTNPLSVHRTLIPCAMSMPLGMIPAGNLNLHGEEILMDGNTVHIWTTYGS